MEFDPRMRSSGCLFVDGRTSVVELIDSTLSCGVSQKMNNAVWRSRMNLKHARQKILTDIEGSFVSRCSYLPFANKAKRSSTAKNFQRDC